MNGVNGDGPHPGPADGLIELTPEEIAATIVSRGGRSFHSHGNLPWPLPADGPEQVRLNALHNLLQRIVGDVLNEPVREALAPVPGSTRRALDIGTGTGKWAKQLATSFPHAVVFGVDIVPTMHDQAIQDEPTNLRFQTYDVTGGFDASFQPVDLVHARGISMGIRNYGNLVGSIADLLRPNGLFLSGEWLLGVVANNPNDCPHTIHFFEAVQAALLNSGVPRGVEQHIADIVQLSQRFAVPQVHTFDIPIGGWPADEELRDIGAINLRVQKLFVEGMTDLLTRRGMDAAACASLIGHVKQELETVQGLHSRYRAVYATRL